MLKNLIQKTYHWVMNTGILKTAKKADTIMQKLGGRLYIQTLGQLKYKLRFEKAVNASPLLCESIYCNYDRSMESTSIPLVSILIPTTSFDDTSTAFTNNLPQTYPNTEFVFVFREETESFSQWIRKGISQAKGQFLWIIERRVHYERDFLQQMIPLFAYESVMLAICENTVVTADNKNVFSAEAGQNHSCVLADHFIKKLHNEANSYDISGMLFRKPTLTDIDKDSIADASELDLLWIARLIRGGNVAISHEASCHNSNPRTAIVMPSINDSSLHVAMVCYALKSGGGETYPIYLANQMRQQGITVTIINLDLEEREPQIAQLIHPDVPIINLKHTDFLGQALKDLHVNIIHTHQATADYAVALWLSKYPELGKHIITLHGMYETIDSIDCTRAINATIKNVEKYVYIADKNLDCFKKRNLYQSDLFQKIPNGLPTAPVSIPLSRNSLGLHKEDFVLVLASRAIPDKGWYETIEAVTLARKTCKRPIHLLLLGDGPERQRLEKNAPEYIHFLGTVTNVRDYFAIADAGILPSKYKGESYPIVVMECLTVGKPVIATDIGEIANQLMDSAGNRAGILLSLNRGNLNISDISDAIQKLATESALYELLRKNTYSASEKFDFQKNVAQYIELYQEVCK